MTLPSTRRPPEVEELLRLEASEVDKENCLKLKIDKKTVFMKSMIAWHDKLKPVHLDALTKNGIIKKAGQIAYKLRLAWDKLPNDWLRILHDEHGWTFKLSRPKRKNWVGQRQRVKDGDYAEVQPPPQKKTRFDQKFIDLTDQPPPQDWLDNYMKRKYVVPRTLKRFQTEDNVTIIYYDYTDNMKPLDGRKRRRTTIPHDRDGVWKTYGQREKTEPVSPDSTAP